MEQLKKHQLPMTIEEQIDNLKAHFDARLDDYQEDVSYLISKTGKQEKQILSMSRQVKHILP